MRNFLGLERFSQLAKRYQEEQQNPPKNNLNIQTILLAILISQLPAFAAILEIYKDTVDIKTVFVGCSAIFAMILRKKIALQFGNLKDLKSYLSVTHTAIALGCIPTVILLFANPELLNFVGETSGAKSIAPHANSFLSSKSIFVLQVAIWAGVTEEIIFRGMLVSYIRRIKYFKSALTRDLLAIFGSGFLFGLAHLPTWGWGMSLALSGLGSGFSLAYILSKERLLPVVVYHIIFDILSLSAIFFMRKIT